MLAARHTQTGTMKMPKLYCGPGCASCCAILSVWGILQLVCLCVAVCGVCVGGVGVGVGVCIRARVHACAGVRVRVGGSLFTGLLVCLVDG